MRKTSKPRLIFEAKFYVPECLHLSYTGNIQAVVFYSKFNLLTLPLSVNDMKHATVLSGVCGQLDNQEWNTYFHNMGNSSFHIISGVLDHMLLSSKVARLSFLFQTHYLSE